MQALGKSRSLLHGHGNRQRLPWKLVQNSCIKHALFAINLFMFSGHDRRIFFQLDDLRNYYDIAYV